MNVPLVELGVYSGRHAETAAGFGEVGVAVGQVTVRVTHWQGRGTQGRLVLVVIGRLF